jgi:hypothetical protein
MVKRYVFARRCPSIHFFGPRNEQRSGMLIARIGLYSRNADKKEPPGFFQSRVSDSFRRTSLG